MDNVQLLSLGCGQGADCGGVFPIRVMFPVFADHAVAFLSVAKERRRVCRAVNGLFDPLLGGGIGFTCGGLSFGFGGRFFGGRLGAGSRG